MPPLYFVALTLAGLLPSNIVTAYLGAEVAGDVPREYWMAGLVLIAAGCAAWWSMSGRGRVLDGHDRRRVAAKDGSRLVSEEGSSVAPPPSG
jgi:hypothetical protein